ncbi:hypothetical protein ACFX13_046106 [Malus domestica]
MRASTTDPTRLRLHLPDSRNTTCNSLYFTDDQRQPFFSFSLLSSSSALTPQVSPPLALSLSLSLSPLLGCRENPTKQSTHFVKLPTFSFNWIQIC